ncbi:putative ATP-dependent serine protease that mediates the selective degradation of misfolded, unassembled or oxidatively damaged polypeptides as well as certain short-lived regulatory proteins in the mitochondrial matrix [Lyophyllum shimeji]|uniref:Lon protease homolog, mitochondrial n=1 Tax=Lyophyllum shimeji TaxID=47721 RepID=A0A9P3PT18_LYOSH|nr:putative ATP-dependent serine protease that mediates the selective degradation of misfolded, unassembled or oxidatively damaged polypeptides as well as certain short-lived regulatory proteins in the mitochondrial matrix [Lyophyllum shimeji]
MSWLGWNCLRAAAVRHSCSRSILSSALNSRSLSRRTLTVSAPVAFSRTPRSLYSPRWVNPKNGQGAKPDEQAEADQDEDGVAKLEEDKPPDSTQPPPDPPSDPQAPANPPNAPQSPPSSPPPSRPSSSSIAKQSVPEVYPQVLALPIARRPLFPGFYKAVVIRNPSVVAAIKEMMKRGQPYLGAFLLKDENADSDVITDIDSVHSVGVLAQITSVFAAAASGKEGEDKEEGLTAVLYPHRRIKITKLVKAGGVSQAEVKQEDQPQTVEPPSLEGPVQTNFLFEYPVSIVHVENLATQPYNKDDQYIRAFMSEIVSVFKDIAQLNPLFRDQITNFSINQVASNVFDEPDKLADFAAAVSSGEVGELQDVLESLQVEDRLRKALLVLKKELINAQLQSKLSRDVDSKIAKRQREYYLMEQLKGIKKELGIEGDGKDKLIEKFKERAKQLKMPELVRKVFDEELNKLASLEPAASEASVTRNYLEWLTQIPWGTHTPENFSLPHARRILDADHYGLTDVKARILEFLAVGKLRGTVQGKIICLVGPPGVGKTSIGKSIAGALGRRFFRFSVGGMTDVAEIKGHRRTYVGALPGKIIQALKRVGTENPLVLIDEVDKIGRGINGDPASALLEMLDPEQNNSFLDHYMDVPVDLSRVLFVCTANTLDTIPAPLLDRMEVLEVSGYVTEEKLVIAERYLAPQAREASGLGTADVLLDRQAVDVLIKYYCRESGVRNLKKHIEKIYRKAALKIVQELGEETLPEPQCSVEAAAAADPTQAPGEQRQTPAPDPLPSQETPPSEKQAPQTPLDKKPVQSPADTTPNPSQDEPKNTTTAERKPMQVPETVHVRITPESLKEYVGPPVYQKDRMYAERPPPGVSTGLGYLGNGSGAVMPVEAMSMPGKGGLQLTGKLGEVIRESAQIGLSWVKSHAFELGITTSAGDQFLNERDVHVHMPEGSIGKEGPSAGTAILSAFVSLFTKTRIDPDIAMTGEISLVGQVLPVGGLKEKILAAHRAGIKVIVAPAANRADIEENVPESVKTGIRFVYVETVKEVLEEVFHDAPIMERWKEMLL